MVFSGGQRDSDETSTEVLQIRDDYYLKNFAMTVFDADGVIVQLLEGGRLTQAPHGGEISVILPKVTLAGVSSNWILSAESGRMDAAMVLGNLRNVTAIRGTDAQRLVVTTPVLSLDLKAQTARSKSGVRVTHLDNQIESQMMEIDLTRQHITLSKEVQGVYFP